MFFQYKHESLYWQDIKLKEITNDIVCKLQKNYEYEGAFFLYHKNILHQRVSDFIRVFPNSLFYFSVKSLSNINILKELCQYKKVGLDVVSVGEMHRGFQAGFDAERMVFSGVGKTEKEIQFAIQKRIKSIHIESLSELKKVIEISKQEKISSQIALRLNPSIDTFTHEYIATGAQDTKFGIDSRELDDALQLIIQATEQTIQLSSLHIHLGSQIFDAEPYIKALIFLNNFLEKHQYLNIHNLSLGGGFGIDYKSILLHEKINKFPLEKLSVLLAKNNKNNYKISFEPGRFISAPSGLLMCRVLYIKPKAGCHIGITNAGMSELIRPTLYQAEHRILNIVTHTQEKKKYDIVGPICETGDFFVKGASLNTLREGDYLAVTHAGAYASSMSSNYNSRPFVPEVLIDNRGNFQIIKKPQRYKELFINELFE